MTLPDWLLLCFGGAILAGLWDISKEVKRAARPRDELYDKDSVLMALGQIVATLERIETQLARDDED